MPEVDAPAQLADVWVQRLEAGDGETKPSEGSKLQINYIGWLRANGECFDESEDYEVEIGSGDNIVGLETVLCRMSLGERVLCVIPSPMAYGEEGAADGEGGMMIPQNADLVFDITLASID